MIEQRLREWLDLVSAIDCSQPTEQQVRQLRSAIAVANAPAGPTDQLSPDAISHAAELLRISEDKIRQAAAAVGFSDADQPLLFAAEYETRANAWYALEAGVWNANAKRI